MTRKTERRLRREVDDLKRERTTEDDRDWTVEWQEADPESRPDGMTVDLENACITYDLWKAQQETLGALRDSDNDIVGFLAGYAAGKSVLGARWIIAQALAYPGSRFLAMGQDFTKARDTTHRILREQLPGDRTGKVTRGHNGPEKSPIVRTYDRKAHQLTLVNDAEIKFGSADTWGRYAGDEFGAIWLDEPSLYDDLHDLLEMLGSRLRGVDGPNTQLWTLTGSGYNAAWEILHKRIDDNGDPLNLEITVNRASTLDSPYLDQTVKERFERQFGDTARERQALHGGFAAAQGLVYSEFQRDTHVIPHEEASQRVLDDWRVYGYDAGWRDPRVLLEIGRTGYDQLIVIGEFYETQSHVRDAIEWLEEEAGPKGTIFCEHAPSDIEKIKRAGFRAKKAEKDIDAGIAEVRRRLEGDGNLPVDDQPGAQRLTWDGGQPTDRVGLLISTKCRHLIREFLSYKEDQVGSTDANDHCLDSLRYACMGVTTNQRQTIPSTWYDPATRSSPYD